MKLGVVVFPGSNCDHDTLHVLETVCGAPARLVWHKESDLSDLDGVVIPGGFSYGDYLRTGAIARFSPVMQSVKALAEAGKPVLGICNGFQILQEAGLLPGAMLRNRSVRFESRPVHVRVERTDTAATRAARAGAVLTMPIAHGEGNFYLPEDEAARLEGEGRVVFRYVTVAGESDEEANVNGSVNAIAGICNERRNVVALMPHPERAAEKELGSTDGKVILQSFVEAALGAA